MNTLVNSVQTNPPQVLLTNYVMAELLLVRPDDQTLLPAAEPAGTASPRLRRIAHVSRTPGLAKSKSHRYRLDLNSARTLRGSKELPMRITKRSKLESFPPAMTAATTGS